MLNEVVASNEYSVVRPLQEEIDKRFCHVLERPAYDRLWIDVERGCALLARETHAQLNGALVQRIELSGHKEVSPGIWFPTKLRNIQYDYLCPDRSKRSRVVTNVAS